MLLLFYLHCQSQFAVVESAIYDPRVFFLKPCLPFIMPANTATAPSPAAATPTRKAATVPEKKYKCQYCNRAFSRSEHRSRHERSRKFSFLLCSGVDVHSGVVSLLPPTPAPRHLIFPFPDFNTSPNHPSYALQTINPIPLP